MKILLSWLREYLTLADPAILPDLLTRAGIEVDHVEELKPNFTGVVAARIKHVTHHPHSPQLACVTIFDGKTEYTVVCSAPNCRDGLITAYAPIGAHICHKHVDKVSFGDVCSDGMLCSERELGLSDYHDGIVELPHDVKEGTILERYFSDTIYEVSITPNLGHCQSIMGVARELSAFLGEPLKKRPWLESGNLQPKKSAKLSIKIQDNSLCPRYSALLVEEVQVSPSPSWVRIRLERTGHRSINNIVDITNYISHEIGQPLHAFDADRVHHGELIVRPAHGNESLTFLDAVTRKLPEGTIVIADKQQILAAGGIMGGESSAVTNNTQRVIFESAYFNPSAIRHARTKLALNSDSSKRFERGVDPNVVLKALDYVYEYLKLLSPKLHLEALEDVSSEFPEKKITCRLSRASLILGYDVSANEAETAFSRLGFTYSFDGQEIFIVTVPSFRHDLVEEIDLIEEIGRLVGLERESPTPIKYSSSTLAHHPLYLFEGELRRRLTALGLQEAMTGDLISPLMAKLVTDHTISEEWLVKMLNPLSSEQSILRPSLLPGLLEVLQHNFNQRILDVSFFEIGNAHLKKQNTFQEPRVFALMLSGLAKPLHFSEPPRDYDFFDLKGMLEELFSTLHFPTLCVQRAHLALFHPGRQAKLFVDNVHVGMMGELHPEVLAKFDIQQRALFAECDLQDLLHLGRANLKMQELPTLPSSERDWTVTVSKNISFDEIMAKINQVKPSICESSSLVAIFEHEKLGENRQNVTFHFVYRDRNKTVSQEEVEQAHQQLVAAVSHYLAEKYPE